MTTVVDVAIICHEANKAYCDSIYDDSQKHWNQAEQGHRDSYINGVKFHLANPGAGPDASHINWMAHKLAHGWRYGLRKDEKRKTHYCLVPFKDLPAEEQLKDVLFLNIVNTLRDYIKP